MSQQETQIQSGHCFCIQEYTLWLKDHLYQQNWGVFCCYFFWCWPARWVCQPLQPGNTWYTIVDDDVEAAPIYRCAGKALHPTRPHENHGLAIEWLPTWMESKCKQQLKSLVVLASGSLENSSKIQGNTEIHVTSGVRLRIAPYTVPSGSMMDKWLNDYSQLTSFLHHSILPLWWTIHIWHMSTLQRACVLIAVGSSRTIKTVSQ